METTGNVKRSAEWLHRGHNEAQKNRDKPIEETSVIEEKSETETDG